VKVSDGTRTRDRLDHNQESSLAGQPIEVRKRAGPTLPPVDVYQASTTRTRPATPATRPRQGPARFAGASCPGLTALRHLQAGSTTHPLPKPP